MDAMVYLDQENGTLSVPSLKARQRLRSAPENLLKTPLKTRLGAPAHSGRKALGTVNKLTATPVTAYKVDELNKHLASQGKLTPDPVPEEYPEIEKFFPYDPSDFEECCVPEEVCISRYSLAGLGKRQWLQNVPEDDFMIQPCLPQSPLKMPSEHSRDDLEAFLETISALTVALPSEWC